MIYDVSCYIYIYIYRHIRARPENTAGNLQLRTGRSSSSLLAAHRPSRRRRLCYRDRGFDVFTRSSTFRNSIKSVSLHFVREFYIKLHGGTPRTHPLLPLLLQPIPRARLISTHTHPASVLILSFVTRFFVRIRARILHAFIWPTAIKTLTPNYMLRVICVCV